MATITVGTDKDYATIQEAIDAAANGDTIAVEIVNGENGIFLGQESGVGKLTITRCVISDSSVRGITVAGGDNGNGEILSSEGISKTGPRITPDQGLPEKFNYMPSAREYGDQGAAR